mgnify:CR=1 FL=1
MMHILIIGGGAAGMAAAIAAARAGQAVTVLERGRRLLQKAERDGKRTGQPAERRRARLSRRNGLCRAGARRHAL